MLKDFYIQFFSKNIRFECKKGKNFQTLHTHHTFIIILFQVVKSFKRIRSLYKGFKSSSPSIIIYHLHASFRIHEISNGPEAYI